MLILEWAVEEAWALSAGMTKVLSYSLVLAYAKQIGRLRPPKPWNVAKRMGFNKIHIEGDALNVISAINSKTTGRAHIYVVYDLLLSMLPLFENFKASFARRGVTSLPTWWLGGRLILMSEKFVCLLCLRSLAELDLS